MELYYQPHISRKRERAFIDHLTSLFPGIVRIEHCYPLPSRLAERTLNIRRLERRAANTSLSPLPKKRLLLELAKLPDEIKIITSTSQLSCDTVLCIGQKIHFFEFHEAQHRRLSSARPAQVFSLSGESIPTPRFVQRFLRDVWRAVYLRPFTIIWADWFEKYGNNYAPDSNSAYEELALDGTFTFKELLAAP